MSNSNHHREANDRLSAPWRAAALIAFIAVLALIVVSFESPWMRVAPDQPLARIANIHLTADGPAPTAVEPTLPADVVARTRAPVDYFPSHFSAPRAPAEEPVQAF